MITLSKRSYADETDLPAIANLINACEAVDQLEQGTSVSELEQSLDNPWLDKNRDICLWEDAGEKLIGYSLVSIPKSGEEIDCFLWFRVHPTARGGDLESQIIAWGEGRLREVSQERGMKVKLRSGARADQSQLIALLESHGFIPERYFFIMERSLLLPIPAPKLPEGFILRQVEAQQDAEAWVEMFNQSFIDHWNHHELTAERYQYYVTQLYYQPELDLIALAADGTFAAFCEASINPEANQRSGRNDSRFAHLKSGQQNKSHTKLVTIRLRAR
ncbi:MAG: GNAT family N-acetyltransferase [Symploca sp. SIO3E6]|nr:GNAT family N-acetyltransferase [Caldora sp. SIO3E6]